MDHHTLLDIAANLGQRLATSGAETFRVEESVSRILAAYGVKSQVFAIPNCLIITLETDEGVSITQMRRITKVDNDLDAVERYNNLSRKICSCVPDPQVAAQWLAEIDRSRTKYTLPLLLLGSFLGSCGFAIFFGATVPDSLCAGICGLLVGIISYFANRLQINLFFSTIAEAFVMAAAAYIMGAIGLATNTDTVVIGALMILVPGLLFTNAMRDIIFGDTNSGINRIVQVFLIAAAIALGTGTAWSLVQGTLGIPANPTPLSYSPVVQCLASVLGCFGFSFLFNIHGKGILLCIFGGGLVWASYSVTLHFTGNSILSYFVAAIVSATYSEMMARIRKYPAISYLVISLFPIFPGSGIYYATELLVRGEMSEFAAKASDTVAIAGVIAVGVLTVSTLVRLRSSWIKNKNSNKRHGQG